MITEWHVKNFKSILDQKLTLAPLTIFCGVNSSGKSSFLQTIAMLAQSARSGSPHFSLNGDLVNLGSFDHVYCRKSKELDKKACPEIMLNFTIATASGENIEVDLNLEKDGRYYYTRIKHIRGEDTALFSDDGFDTASENEIRATHWGIIDDGYLGPSPHKIDPYDIDIIFDYQYTRIHRGDTVFLPVSIDTNFIYKDEKIDLFLEFLARIPDKELATPEDADRHIAEEEHDLGIDIGDPVMPNYIWDSLFKIFMDSMDPDFEGLFEQFREGGSFNLKLVDWFQVTSKQTRKQKDKLRNYIKSERCKNFFTGYMRNQADMRVKGIEMPKALKYACNYLHDFFGAPSLDKPSVQYMGALREESQWDYEPKKLYESVNVKGKNTVAVVDFLHRKFKKVKKYRSSANIYEETDEKQPHFAEALMKWIEYIVGADDFDVSPPEEEKLELLLHFNGEKFALPQLGTGISQVLPILVMCLAAEPGSTIAIQEPEAHLHPKMQSRLADFFIAMSLSGRQCLIETHSEYMIEQLRYRVITQEETDKEKLHEKTKLYFVSKKEGVSQFKKIEMNSYAKLSEWPEDFFDESNKLADKITDEILRKLEGDDLDD